MKTQEEKLALIRKAFRYEYEDSKLNAGGTVGDLMLIIRSEPPRGRTSIPDFLKEGVSATAEEKIALTLRILRAEDPHGVFRSSVRIDRLIEALEEPELATMHEKPEPIAALALAEIARDNAALKAALQTIERALRIRRDAIIGAFEEPPLHVLEIYRHLTTAADDVMQAWVKVARHEIALEDAREIEAASNDRPE